jgi:hypothetical protein
MSTVSDGAEPAAIGNSIPQEHELKHSRVFSEYDTRRPTSWEDKLKKHLWFDTILALNV